MKLLAAVLVASLALPAWAQTAPALLPQPAVIKQQGQGSFRIGEDIAVSAPTALQSEAGWLAERLKAGIQRDVPVKAQGAAVQLSIDASLPPEGYRLSIAADKVSIQGGTSAGVFYGAVTFLQCLPPAVFGDFYDETLERHNADWSAPLLTIEDAPATSWRGVMLDSARHFQPKAWILKLLDAMAAHKLNRLHWHLVDNEAWRLEIKKYPKLVQVQAAYPASYIDEIPTNPTIAAMFRYGYFHGGGFYSQADVKDIVAYATARHIVIVPEIEFPGHAQAALTAYPEFGTTRRVPVIRSNHSPDLMGVHPEALQFLRDVLDETMALFPGEWVHFGGDEAPKVQWKQDQQVQAQIDNLGLRINDSDEKDASESALQAWMFNQLAAHIAKNGRRAVGWEEVMHGRNIDHLVKGAAIMPWLSQENAAKAANAGYGVIHTDTPSFYLDSYQSTHPAEPSTLYEGPLTPEVIYNFPLYPATLTAEGRKNILGAEAQLWTELMPRTDDVEYQAFPRVSALAELTWTVPQSRTSYEHFAARLATHGDRLTALGLNHRHAVIQPSLAWTPAFLLSRSAWSVAVPDDMARKLAAGGELRVSFCHEKGDHRLVIRNVLLKQGDQELARDTHDGLASASPSQNDYALKVPAGPGDRTLTLVIDARGHPGNDSKGRVVLEVR